MSDLKEFLDRGAEGFDPKTDWFESTLRRVRRRERNRKILAGILAALIAAGVGTGLGLALTSAPRKLPVVNPKPTPTTPKVRNGQIDYIAQTNNEESLYAVKPDGTGRTRLGPRYRYSGSMSFSPDGTRVVVEVVLGEGQEALDVMNANGTHEHQITHSPLDAYNSPAWSPDGTQVAFVTGNGQLAVMRANGGSFHLIPGLPPKCTEESASWAPDSLRLVYELDCRNSSSIEVVATDGTGRKTLVGPVPAPEGNGLPRFLTPGWSPDGTHIAFIQTDLDPSSGYQLTRVYVMYADGLGIHRLTQEGVESAPVWSPDGTTIAFLSNRGKTAQVYLMNADGTNQRQLTHEPGDVVAFAWQPLPLSFVAPSPLPRHTNPPKPPPSPRPSPARCVTGRSSGQYAPPGEITVCPSAGPVNSLVTISGNGCHNSGDLTQLAVFLGPTDYIGTGGGGESISLPIDRSGRFHGTFRMPPQYTGGGNNANPMLPTRPGLYHFATYPLGACAVTFTVTAK